jgi:hypothetical protein
MREGVLSLEDALKIVEKARYRVSQLAIRIPGLRRSGC